jgi:hypothetical protein
MMIYKSCGRVAMRKQFQNLRTDDLNFNKEGIMTGTIKVMINATGLPGDKKT